jgi:signal recognition particle GTPase
MDDSQAMREALANIKALCKRSLVDRYKAKKAAPAADALAEDLGDDEADEMLDDSADEADEELEDEPAKEKGLTSLVFLGGKSSGKSAKMAKVADEMMPKKRGPGRPKKQK